MITMFSFGSFLRARMGISSIIAEVATMGIARVPILISVALITIGISSCGSLALVLGFIVCIWKVKATAVLFSWIVYIFIFVLTDVWLLRRSDGITSDRRRESRSRRWFPYQYHYIFDVDLHNNHQSPHSSRLVKNPNVNFSHLYFLINSPNL